MNLKTFFEAVGLWDAVKSAGMLLVLVSLVVQITPIKLNPWSWLAKKIGNAINSDVLKKLDETDKEVKSLKSGQEKLQAGIEETKAVECRIRILRFGDDVCHKIRHTEEHFNQTMRDIDDYERYTKEHPEFLNGITAQTVARIREVYRECRVKNDFL